MKPPPADAAATVVPGRVDLLRAGIIRHTGHEISGALQKARRTGIDRQGDEGIRVPKLVYHMQGLVFLNRVPPLLKSRHPRPGKAAKTEHPAPKVSPIVSCCSPPRRSTIPATGKEMLQDHSPQSLWRVDGMVKIHICVVSNSI
jgi:hypothetical protein